MSKGSMICIPISYRLKDALAGRTRPQVTGEEGARQVIVHPERAKSIAALADIGVG